MKGTEELPGLPKASRTSLKVAVVGRGWNTFIPEKSRVSQTSKGKEKVYSRDLWPSSVPTDPQRASRTYNESLPRHISDFRRIEGVRKQYIKEIHYERGNVDHIKQANWHICLQVLEDNEGENFFGLKTLTEFRTAKKDEITFTASMAGLISSIPHIRFWSCNPSNLVNSLSRML